MLKLLAASRQAKLMGQICPTWWWNKVFGSSWQLRFKRSRWVKSVQNGHAIQHLEVLGSFASSEVDKSQMCKMVMHLKVKTIETKEFLF